MTRQTSKAAKITIRCPQPHEEAHAPRMTSPTFLNPMHLQVMLQMLQLLLPTFMVIKTPLDASFSMWNGNPPSCLKFHTIVGLESTAESSWFWCGQCCADKDTLRHLAQKPAVKRQSALQDLKRVISNDIK